MSNVPWTLLWRCRIIHLARPALCNTDNDERNERVTKKTAKRFGEKHCLVSRSVLRLSGFINGVSRHMHKMEIEIEINRRVKSRSMQDKLDINVLFHFSPHSLRLSFFLFIMNISITFRFGCLTLTTVYCLCHSHLWSDAFKHKKNLCVCSRPRQRGIKVDFILHREGSELYVCATSTGRRQCQWKVLYTRTRTYIERRSLAEEEEDDEKNPRNDSCSSTCLKNDFFFFFEIPINPYGTYETGKVSTMDAVSSNLMRSK